MPTPPRPICSIAPVDKQSTGQAGPEIDRDLEVLFLAINQLARCVAKIAQFLDSLTMGGFGSGSAAGSLDIGSQGGAQGSGGTTPLRGFTQYSPGSNFTLPDDASGTIYITPSADIELTLPTNPILGQEPLTIVHAGAAQTITLKNAGSTIGVMVAASYTFPIFPLMDSGVGDWPDAVPIVGKNGAIYTQGPIVLTDDADGIFLKTAGNYVEVTGTTVGPALVVVDTGSSSTPS